MLDHLCRGRFYWGIGTRAIPTDLELYGLDSTDRVAVGEKSREVLDVVLKMWQNEGKFEYHGKYFDIDAPELDSVKERGLHMKPFQEPLPPISAAATTIAARLARSGWTCPRRKSSTWTYTTPTSMLQISKLRRADAALSRTKDDSA